jgi:hypothetical protein
MLLSGGLTAMRRLRHLIFLLLVTCSAALFWSAPCAAQQILNNDAIIRLTEAGLSDDLIIQTIKAQPGHYATGAGDLVTLKQEGVSERVIGAMIDKASTSSTKSPTDTVSDTPISTPGVDEIGVYYKKDDGKDGPWIQMQPEVVNYKSGGWVKSTVTNGIVKQDRNGHINGNVSQLVLARGTSFLLYVPEGVSPVEYQLLKLRINSDNREFRSQTGGVFHSSTGGDRDNVPFSAERIAPRMYRFTLSHDVAKGEYGILPPGIINASNVTRAGKIYTFAIIE